MNSVAQKIKAVMTGRQKNGFSPLSAFLFVASLGYGFAVKLREKFYKNGVLKSKKLSCMVISVGNIAVGGAGKTPMTIYIARLIRQSGYKVAVISRGYKGSAEKSGGVVSDGHTIYMGPETAGDEPFLMASCLKDIPVLVGQDRFKTGTTALNRFAPDVIVLDDGFQHLQLERDMDIVLLDHADPFGNTRLLPRGILREPVSSLGRGDIFILTRSDSVKSALIKELEEFTPNCPVFKAFHLPYIYRVVKSGDPVLSVKTDKRISECDEKYDPEIIRGHKVVAFSGIAKNNNFYRTLEDLGCDILDFFKFSDHHFYSDKDLGIILQSAIANKAKMIVTTDKDYVKIADKIDRRIDLVVIGIKVAFEDNSAFDALVHKKIAEYRSQPTG